MKLTCPNCHGTGTVARTETADANKWLNVFPVLCDRCSGSGVWEREVKTDEPQTKAPACALGVLPILGAYTLPAYQDWLKGQQRQWAFLGRNLYESWQHSRSMSAGQLAPSLSGQMDGFLPPLPWGTSLKIRG